MTKTTYTTSAVPSQGDAPRTFTRRSHRTYTHAVLVRLERPDGRRDVYVDTWCGRLDLAVKAERSTRNRLAAFHATEPQRGTLLAVWYQPVAAQ